MTLAPASRTPVGLEGRPVYELHGVSKTFARRNVQALDSIDLVLAEGSFASVIGSSGCGKSTLLKIMAGLMPPSAGSVMLAGRPVTGPRRDIGMMFQQATLFPWRTTIENIVLPVEIRDGKAAARAKHGDARALLGLVGLQGFEQVYPNELSGGMAQRATAFLVTHSIAEAVILSDVVYVMSPRPGRFVETVTIDLPRPRTLEMMTEPRFGALVQRIRRQLDKGAFL